MIHNITFENYKGFKEKQELKLKPITILIGKNSSGKSALLRLIIMLSKSLMVDNEYKGEPLIFRSKDFDFGSSFNDLVYQKLPRALKLSMKLDGERGIEKLEVVLRYYEELKKGVIEEYTYYPLGDSPYKFQLDISKIPQEVYQYKKNDKTYSDFNLRFRGLAFQLSYRTDQDNSGIQNLIQSSKYLPEINYQPPLRPNIKPLYHLADDANSTASLLYQNEELLKKVGDWYQEKLNIGKLDINKALDTDFFSLNILKNPFSVRLMDVGQGIGQSLPIVTHALGGVDNTLHLIEQPELHLHPAAHGEIAQLIAESAKNTPNSKFLIETHSENFVLRLRRLVVEGILSPDDLAIYWVEYDEEKEASDLTEIIVDEMGEVNFWPEGVFSENFEEVKAIGEAQLDKKNRTN
jgi:predicted ATPase